MQHKWTVLLTTLVLISLLIAPAGGVRAQDAAPDCPPYEPGLLTEREVLRSLPVDCIRVYKDAVRPADPSKLVGDPDGFGYTYDDAVPYSWINAGTNSGLTGDNEVSGPVDIGFNFPFYGVPQSQLYLSTNGLISFGVGQWLPSGLGMPNEMDPNHFIAPAWDDLLVQHNGAIYYSQGGTAPNRYFVIEWRDVATSYSSPTFSFEAILHENGDIVFQYKSLPSPFWPAVGLEDSLGSNGLEYPSWDLSPLKAIRFYYPAPAVRFQVSPERAGGFVSLNSYKDYNVTITNTGAPGVDTFDISLSSTWPAALYAANGVTPLTDTDADTLLDTGPLQPGTSRTVIARFTTLANAQVGDYNSGLLGITSSLNPSPSIKRWVPLATSIPASFVNVFQDNADGAMSFAAIHLSETKTFKATSDEYFGYNPAVIELPSGNYLYFWAKNYYNATTGWRDLEYAILNRSGNIVVPATKLTNNAGLANDPSDLFPSVALAPNGTIGLVWTRRLNNYAASQYNYNIFFATLGGSGNLLTGPTNLTNNAAWGGGSTTDVPRFFSPTIAASSDNRFVIGWENEQRGLIGGLVSDVWYAVRSTDGTSVLAPTRLTDNTASLGPILNSLTGGKVILTWITLIGGPNYAVINSNGTISKPETSLQSGADSYSSPDAVQLPNGNVAVAWGTDTGVQFAILNSAHTRIYGPTSAPNPFPAYPAPIPGDTLSVTTDSSSHVIMTWAALDHVLLYALGSSTGSFLTQPMQYKTSGYYVDVSLNGQGNAPYEEGDPLEVKIGGVVKGTYGLLPSESRRVSYAGVNNGPVSIESTNAAPALAAERLIYKVNNVATSFTEMMGLPNSQLDSTYWLPWYNNVELDTQLRFANVSSSLATVHVYIGGNEMPGSPFTLQAGASARKSFPGVNAGPVQIVSDHGVPIVAAERLIYKVNGVNASFSETMAVPNSQLDTTYWLPWYNNAELDTQLRFANVTDQPASVHVYIGGNEMPGSPFTLDPGASTRKSFPGVNAGPVQIVSDRNIVAAERLIYKVNNVATSFTEMMALPNSQLDTTYWLPWYNNKELDTQLRFANTTNTPASVHIYIGGDEMQGSPFTLQAGESTRKSFANINNGPVQIVSDQNIVAAERLIYKVNNVATSFSEMMALPASQLDTTYWLPWYNNVELDTQLRFGVP